MTFSLKNRLEIFRFFRFCGIQEFFIENAIFSLLFLNCCIIITLINIYIKENLLL